MKFGFGKSLALTAMAAAVGFLTACSTETTKTIDDVAVDSSREDYVSRMDSNDNGDTGLSRVESRAKATTSKSTETGKTTEVAQRGRGAAGSSGRLNVSDKDLNHLADFYADEANRLYRNSKFEDALQYANDALAMNPKQELAAQIKIDAQQALGVQGGVAGNMARARSNEEAALRAEAMYEISSGLDRADRMIRNGEFTEALAELESVLDTVRWTDYMVETEGFEREARLLIQEAKQRREEARLEDFVKIREQERRLRELEIQQELDRYREEVRNLYEQAKEYFDRKEYQETVIVLNKILREDPYNEQVARLKSIAISLRAGQRDRQAFENFQRAYKESMLMIKASNAFPLSHVVAPSLEDYRRAEQRASRLEASRRTQLRKEDIAVRSALENNTVSLNFSIPTRLQEIVDVLKRQGKVNIAIRQDVDKDTEVILDYGDVRLKSALAFLAIEAEISWRVENGAVIIDAEGASAGASAVRRVFNVADLLINLMNFQADEPRLSGDSDGDPRLPPEEEEEEPEPLEIDALADLILESISPETWDLDGHGIAYRQKDLIVRNSPEIIDRVANLLSDLRRSQGLTVMVEARFITIRDDFLEDIGLDFRGVGGSPQIPPPGNPPVPAALDDIQFGNNSRPAGPGGTGNAAGFFFQDIPASGNTRVDSRARIENLFDQSLGGRRGNQGLTNAGGASFQLAFVDNPEINAILRAVRKQERATLLTAPRVTVHNTQRGHVSILNEVAYISDFSTQSATGVAVADPIVDVIRDGIVLDVRPTISADRRYVTLELRPTLAILLRPIPTFNTSLGVGTPVAIQTPQLTLQRLRTTVTIPDGGSFVIGGLRKMTETQVESGIPIISDLPLIGTLFKRQGKSVVRQDIIVVVTARIIDLVEETEVTFEGGPSSPR